jgi:hypothetical protein
MEFQKLIITSLYINWRGVRREVVGMMTLKKVSYEDGIYVFSPSKEKVHTGNVRSLTLPIRKKSFN